MNKINKHNKFYKDKKVLITGHTGFVGSWLSLLMLKFNSKVYGISKNALDNSFNYKNLSIKNDLKGEYFLDINNFNNLNKKIKIIKPDIIFHLAAQPYVIEGYENPIDTLKTNIIGTANLLRSSLENKIKHNVIITSDKCYNNLDKKTFFNENSEMGGSDPYSVSKGCAELITKSFSQSYNNNIYIHTVRAGNIIGGGDFGKNRLIPDIYYSKIKNKKLNIRYPNAIRPWQNILDVINSYSYIPVAQASIKNRYDCWNIGPRTNDAKINVIELVEKFLKNFDKNKQIRVRIKNNHLKESIILMLNSNKIRKKLNWKNIFNTNQTIKQTSEWYKICLNGSRSELKEYSIKLLNELFKRI